MAGRPLSPRRCPPERSSTGGGALVRLAAPNSYVWAFAGQCVIAAGQPLVLNAITKIAARYFPARPSARRRSRWAAWRCSRAFSAAALSGGPLLDAGGLTLLVWAQAGPSRRGGGVGARHGARRPRHSPRRCPSRPRWAGSGATASCGCSAACCSSAWASSTRSRRGCDSILTHFGRGGAAVLPDRDHGRGGSGGCALLPGSWPPRGTTPRRAAGRDRGQRAGVRGHHRRCRTQGSSPSCCPSRASSCSLRLPVVLDWSELHAGEQRAGGGGRVPAAGGQPRRGRPRAGRPGADRQSVRLAVPSSGFALAGVALAHAAAARTERQREQAVAQRRAGARTREDR